MKVFFFPSFCFFLHSLLCHLWYFIAVFSHLLTFAAVYINISIFYSHIDLIYSDTLSSSKLKYLSEEDCLHYNYLCSMLCYFVLPFLYEYLYSSCLLLNIETFSWNISCYTSSCNSILFMISDRLMIYFT